MNDHSTDTDLDESLDRLASHLPLPATAVSEDLARGVRRARRRTAGTAVASLAIAAVAGAAIWSATGRDSAPVQPAGASDPSAEVTAASTSTPTAVGSNPATASTQGATASAGERKRAYKQETTLLDQYWMPVLRAAVDPTGEHLDKKVSNVQGSSHDGAFGVGTKLGWKTPGEQGQGLVQVFLEQRAKPGCADYVRGTCTTLKPPPGTRGAWAWQEGNTRGVRVLRADATAVEVSSDPLFGNNSLVPIATQPLDQSTMLALAASPDLSMPPGMVELQRAQLNYELSRGK